MPASDRGTNGLGEFKGKRVLVTGGTKGTGKAIAARFLQGGATVAITARSAPTETTAAHFIQADVSTREGTAHIIREVLSRFRGVDLIIHNVGGSSAPKRIVLGSDAYGAIHKALTDRLSALEAQREVAFSTDFPKDEKLEQTV